MSVRRQVREAPPCGAAAGWRAPVLGERCTPPRHFEQEHLCTILGEAELSPDTQLRSERVDTVKSEADGTSIGAVFKSTRPPELAEASCTYAKKLVVPEGMT